MDKNSGVPLRSASGQAIRRSVLPHFILAFPLVTPERRSLHDGSQGAAPILNANQGNFDRSGEQFRLSQKDVGNENLLCLKTFCTKKKLLPGWHPLLSGRKESVREAGIMIKNGIHESEVDECDWDEYEILE